MTVPGPQLFDLSGRTALVTGAAGGIGRVIAAALAEAGACVFLGARNAVDVADLALAIGDEGKLAFPWPVDLLDGEHCKLGVEEIIVRQGAIDILVNCAGIVARGSLQQSNEADWNNVLAVNLTVPYRLAKYVAPSMAERGWGRIVNIGSILSIEGKANAVSYVSSKHGLAGLTRALAAELGGRGICVNALCPGYIRTEINLPLQQDAAYNAKIKAATPAGRWGLAEDLAGPALFLCSDAASYVNGHLLVADGGMTATH